MTDLEKIWKNYYQFSQMRHGLLAWYPFPEGARVLEWNPENGALTSYLLSHCSQLTCVVKHENQRKYLSNRFQGENLLFQSEHDERAEYYDMVVAVNPFSSTLTDSELEMMFDRFRRQIKKDGTFLLAVNNTLGIHKNLGIKNTCGKELDQHTLMHLLKKRFIQTKFYYIFPDFVFPQMVYSDEREPDSSLLERMNLYAKNIEEIAENIDTVYRSAAKTHMLKAMANSFLVECTDYGVLCDISGASITSDREVYGMVTAIRQGAWVEKRSICREENGHILNLARNLMELKKKGISTVPFKLEQGGLKMPFLDWEPLVGRMKAVAQESREHFLQLLSQLYHEILKSSETVSEEENRYLARYGHGDWGPVLKKAYIEMTPLNAFYKEGIFMFYDQEFTQNHCPAKYVLFRGITHLYYFDRMFEQWVPLEDVKEAFGLSGLWDVFGEIEKEFLYHVRGGEKNVEFFKIFTAAYQNQYAQYREVPLVKKARNDAGNTRKKIVVWGCGNYFENFLRIYENYYHIDYVVDTNEALWDTEKHGYRIKNPGCLAEEDAMVIIAAKNRTGILEQLKKMRISDIRIFQIQEEEDEYETI